MLYLYKDMVFTEVSDFTEDKENMVIICEECAKKYNISEELLEERKGMSSCMIKDCENVSLGMKMFFLTIPVGELTRALPEGEIFDWEYVDEQMALANPAYKNDEECYVRSIYVGTVFNLLPSGKYYTPWACSNVTEKEAQLDEEWREKAEAECEEHGYYLTAGEGDPCDLFIEEVVDEEEYEHFWEVLDNLKTNIMDEFNGLLQGLDYERNYLESEEDKVRADVQYKTLAKAKEIAKRNIETAKETLDF